MTNEVAALACMRTEDITGRTTVRTVLDTCHECGSTVCVDQGMRDVLIERHGGVVLICIQCAGIDLEPDLSDPKILEVIMNSVEVLAEANERD